MSSGVGELTLYCQHVNASYVHCNLYTTIDIGMDQTAKAAIEESHFEIVDGEIRCGSHQ